MALVPTMTAVVGLALCTSMVMIVKVVVMIAHLSIPVFQPSSGVTDRDITFREPLPSR